MRFFTIRRLIPIRFQIAGAILIVTVIALVFWRMSRPGEPSDRSDGSAEIVGDSTAQDGASVLEKAILCGNVLLEYETGKVIDGQWLDGFGKVAPAIVAVYPEESLVIAKIRHGVFQPFGFDGKPRPLPLADGKEIGAAAYVENYSQVAFIRDGDIWRGQVDWSNSKIDSLVQLTDTGYFKDNTFTFPWLWHHKTLLVRSLGKNLHVDTGTGSVKLNATNLGDLVPGMNPNGNVSLVSSRSGLGVVDMASEELKAFPLKQKPVDFFWLDSQRAVIRVGLESVAEYDHSTSVLTEPVSFGEQIRFIGGFSPDKNHYLIVGKSGFQIVGRESKKQVRLDLLLDHGEWVSNEEFVCSNPQIDTEMRGVWIVNVSGEKRRLTNRPVDSGRPAGGAASPFAAVPGGMLWISEGDLWCYRLEDSEPRKITEGAKLQPFLNTVLHMEGSP